jgi:colanic acid/amylovoran biosynthesis glycosyltransferase
MNDIRNLSGHYKTIFLFTESDVQNSNALPKNVIVIKGYVNWSDCNKIKLLLINFITVWGIIAAEIIRQRKIIPIKKNVLALLLNIYKAARIRDKIAEYRNLFVDYRKLPCYSFWFYDVTFLGILKQRYGFERIFSRAHSGDLYEEHPSRKKRPDLIHYQLKHLDRLLPVSEQGANYVSAIYGQYKGKVSTVYLGTKDCGFNENMPARLTLVSCARFRHHKRLDKIAEALYYTSCPITWMHIGDDRHGEDIQGMRRYMDMIGRLSEKSNVEFVRLGSLANDQIFELYQNKAISLFISLSENEGIPVSIMEAISFGIPAIATDAGGCSEIVNEKTGLLVPVDIGARDVSVLLDTFSSSGLNTSVFRNGVRKFWQENFSEAENYKRLTGIIDG